MLVDIHGPGRHDRDPDRLDHHPVDRRSTSPPTTTAAPASSASSGSSTAPRPATSPAPDPSPVTVTGDGVHALEVRITDDQGRVLELAHAPGQDRHGQPDRQHDRRGRLAPARATSTYSCAAPTRTPGRRASSGGSTAATSEQPPRTTTRSASPATACTPSRPGSSTTPAGAAAGSRTRSSSTPGCPRTRPRPCPRAGATRPTRSCSTAPTATPASPRCSYRIQLEGQPAGAELEGTRNVDPRRASTATARTRSSTRVRDNAGNYSTWRAETVRIDRVLPTDGTVLSGARRSATATSSPSTRRTTARASRASSGSSTAAPSRRRRRRRSPARARTR